MWIFGTQGFPENAPTFFVSLCIVYTFLTGQGVVAMVQLLTLARAGA